MTSSIAIVETTENILCCDPAIFATPNADVCTGKHAAADVALGFWIIQLLIALVTVPLFVFRGRQQKSPLRNRMMLLGLMTGLSATFVQFVLTAFVNYWFYYPPTPFLHSLIVIAVISFFLPILLRIIRLHALFRFNLKKTTLLETNEDVSFFDKFLANEKFHNMFVIAMLAITIVLCIIAATATPDSLAQVPPIAHTPFFVYLQFLIRIITEIFIVLFMIGLLFDFAQHHDEFADNSHILLELLLIFGIFVVELALTLALEYSPTFFAGTAFPPGGLCEPGECYIEAGEKNRVGGNSLVDTPDKFLVDFWFSYWCVYSVFLLVIVLPLVLSYHIERKVRRLPKTKVRLDDVLADPRASQKFHKFLMGEFAIENLLFFQQVVQYRRLADAGGKKAANRHATKADQIVAFFIREESALEVNISSNVRQNILENVSQGHYPRVLFDDACKEVRQLLEGDAMPRLRASDPTAIDNDDLLLLANKRIEREERGESTSLLSTETNTPSSRRRKKRHSKNRKRRSTKK